MTKQTGIRLPILLLTALCMIIGCNHQPDPRLLEADALIDEHPDSALRLLEGLDMPEDAPEKDRATYTMLLTHARYKNFIDEDNDSMIRMAADYFTRHNDIGNAARSLYILGMVQMNTGRLGDAAVSFRKGLDMARENNYYMWEGQCARGLFMLYGDLLDSSSQLKYANESYEAFVKGGFDDWINYSRLSVASAYNNNGKYKKALSLALELSETGNLTSDSIIIEESMYLMGLSQSNIGEFKESLESYAHAYRINPELLTENDLKQISMAASHVDHDSLSDYARSFIAEVSSTESYRPSFVILAEQGRHEEAYQEINRYMNKQDSIFAMLFHNNVSESLGLYEENEKKIAEEKHKTERLFFYVILLVVVMVALCAYLLSRFKLLKREKEMEHLVANIESLRNDLQMQIESNHEDSSEVSDKCTGQFLKLIRENYAEANEICDSYYQNSDLKSTKQAIVARAEKIIHDFTNPESLEEIAAYIDNHSNGLYSSFKRELHSVTKENRRLFLYLLVGFSNRSISVLLQQKTGTVYTKKSRLKDKILKSGATRKDEYLSVFG